MEHKRLLIVDGFSLLYRAFFGTRFLSTADGRPTNALYGFINMVFVLIERERPDAILVAMDAPGKTFRHAEYAEYKGTRREMPAEMVVQIDIVRDVIAAMGWDLLELTGYEADDIIGTVSLQAENNGYKTTIVSGDMDESQLVDPCVTLVTPKQGVSEVAIYDVAGVIARYGFGPELVPDYKALVGDPSDNIPGVPGIGEKSATKLLLEFGAIENIMARMDEVEEKFRKKFDGNLDQLKKSKWLATIVRDVPITYDFKPYVQTPEGIERAKKMLESLEMRAPLKRMPIVFAPYLEGASRDVPTETVEIIAEAINVKSLESIKTPEDLSTWLNGRPYGLSFSGGSTQPSMFDNEAPSEAFFAVGSDVRRVPHAVGLAAFAADPGKAALYESKSVIAQLPAGQTQAGFDAVLAGYVLQSGRSQYAFRDLVQGYLDVEVPATPEQQAIATHMLATAMRDRLDKEGQTKVLDEIELPLVPALVDMERLGIAVSADALHEFSKSLQVQIEITAKKIYEQAGQEFLIASPKQLGDILFEKMGIPGAKKGKTGYSTGAEILQLLAPKYEIATDVMAWRELTKLKSTYADSLPKMIRADGRIHTSFNQTVAATGRLSSNDPNLQNIPIRTELGRHIRRAFIPAPGYTLGSFDYSQIELRLLAHLCGDKALVDAFQRRVDVHTVTASLMFNLPDADVTKDQRRLAKMLNYAVLYGVTDFGLANQLGGGFSVGEAKALIQQYFERFPDIKAFTERTVEDARARGFTTTMEGRRRYFPEIHAANRNERMAAERQAMNAPIQGSAADMMKLAILRVRTLLANTPIRMLLTVHDELVFEFPLSMSPADRTDYHASIQSAMENALPLSVPVEVDSKFGENWDEMKTG